MINYKMKMQLENASYPFSRSVMIPSTYTYDLVYCALISSFGMDGLELYQLDIPSKKLTIENYMMGNEEHSNDRLGETLPIGEIMIASMGIWKFQLTIEEIVEDDREIAELVDYQCDYQLLECCDSMEEYDVFIEEIKQGTKGETYKKLEKKLGKYIDILKVDRDVVNEELRNTYEFGMVEIDRLDEMIEESTSSVISMVHMLIFSWMGNFENVLLHFSMENEMWLWAQHDKNCDHIIMGENIEEMKMMWNSRKDHRLNEMNTLYFSGIAIKFEHAKKVFDIISFAQHKKSYLEEDDVLIEKLTPILDHMRAFLDSQVCDMSQGCYTEISEECSEVKEISLLLNQINTIEVTKVHKELGSGSKGKEKLKVMIADIPDYSNELGSVQKYFLIKGKITEAIVKIEGDNVVSYATCLLDYLCDYIQKKPRPKSIAIEDVNILRAMMPVLNELGIKGSELEELCTWKNLYNQAFNEVNPVTKEELAVYRKMSKMTEYEAEQYYNTLSDQMVEVVQYRMEMPEFQQVLSQSVELDMMN